MREARRVFRLGKSFMELQLINSLIDLTKSNQTSPFDAFLQIGNRLGYCFYWFFDNLTILSAIKVLKYDPKLYAKTGAIFWFIALIFAAIRTLRRLLYSWGDEARLQRKLRTAQLASQADPLKNAVIKLRQERIEIFQNALKTFGDFIPAMAAAEIPQKIFKNTFNDGWIGFGGTLSSIITAWQVYN